MVVEAKVTDSIGEFAGARHREHARKRENLPAENLEEMLRLVYAVLRRAARKRRDANHKLRVVALI